MNEQAYRHREQLLRALLDQSHDILIVVDPATLQLLEANARATSSLLYTHEELLALQITDLASSMVTFFWDEVASARSPKSRRWPASGSARMAPSCRSRCRSACCSRMAARWRWSWRRDASANKAVEDEPAK